VVIREVSAIDSTDLKFVVAQCPPPTVPLGGGGGILGPTGLIQSVEDVALIDNHPVYSGWQMGAKEMNATSNDWQLVAFVICADVPS
jgi:hypothetical protein